MSKDSLGDFLKSQFEKPETARRFLPTLPVYARIDGRGFSKFTKGMQRPYDERMSQAMVDTTKKLVEATNAAIGYTQSDEISLIWHYPEQNQQMMFNGKVQKLASVLASLATAAFTNAVANSEDAKFAAYADKLPHFDARVFQVPDRETAMKFMHWREVDATKNAVSMAAHHHFSHKSLQGMSSAQMQERLFQERGVNFNDYPFFFKRGTYVQRKTVEREIDAETLAKMPEKQRAEMEGRAVIRTVVESFDLGRINTLENPVEVIFEQAAPLRRAA